MQRGTSPSSSAAGATHPSQESRDQSHCPSIPCRGGRRHVHARVLERADCFDAHRSPTAAAIAPPMMPSTPSASGFLLERTRPRVNTDALAELLPSQQPPSHAPCASPMSSLLSLPDGRTEALSSSVAPSVAAAAGVPLSLDSQRRRVAAGTSNPLHIWRHEMAFLKSRHFTSHKPLVLQDGDSDDHGAVKESRPPASCTGSSGSSGTRPHTWGAGGDSDAAKGTAGGPPRTYSESVCLRLSRDMGSSAALTLGSNTPVQHVEADRVGHRARGSDATEVLLTSFRMSDALPAASAGSAAAAPIPTWTSQAKCRTRNINALHAFSWDQRVFLPRRDGALAAVFYLLASPRFWEKVDWAMRGSLLTILPTLILCLEPTTRHIFPMPTSAVFLAYWTTQPTFGAGLRETYIVLKGFTISFLFLSAVVALQPGPKWLSLFIMASALVTGAFVAEEMKRMVAYCLASLLMQYIAHPDTTGFRFIADYYTTLLLGQGIGLASFVFPYIRWSSENARRYIWVTGDAISLSVHGACCSFWVENSLLERQLHVARLRQLRHTIAASMEKAQQGLEEMGYEPHSSVYSTRLWTRMTFLEDVFNIVQSMTLVIEQIAENPAVIETPLCRAFGERLRGELNTAAAAMDAMLLRIVDVNNLVTPVEMRAFAMAKKRFDDAVSSIRDELILSNEAYRPDHSDILLGVFLFSVEEVMGRVANFTEGTAKESNLSYFLRFPLRDLRSSWSACGELYKTVQRRHSITRRLKEAIKISACVMVAAVFQVYVMKSSSTSPSAGAELIAFVYRATGGESFQYAQGRLLGTVLGSLMGLLSVQMAQGYRPVLYLCTLVLTFIGTYVMSSHDYSPLGSALSNSVISIVVQYSNANSAMVRIQQNCFAVLVYFVISSLLWPVRGRTKVKTSFDMSLRMAREATDRLVRNLDLPHSATAVGADVLKLLQEMQSKIALQLQHIPGAKAEPTLDSADFPEMSWRLLVSAQRKLVVTLLMMRHAYLTFMTSSAAEEAEMTRPALLFKDGRNKVEEQRFGNSCGSGSAAAAAAAAAAIANISVHWVVLHRISPYARQMGQLFYEATEVYLLALSNATFVPTAELTRLRLGMMQCYDRIVAVYVDTLQHELHDSGSEEEEEDGKGSGKVEDMNGAGEVGDTGAMTLAFLPGTSGAGARAVERHNLTEERVVPSPLLPPSPTLMGSFAFTTPSGLVIGGDQILERHHKPRPLRRIHEGDTGSGDDEEIRKGKREADKGEENGAGDVSASAPLQERSSDRHRRNGKKGHLAYKLTTEECQQLRDYVLGPGTLQLPNASFFEAVATMAAQTEARASTVTPLPFNIRANGTNLSFFNQGGSLRSPNGSFVDPAMLRHAGIVVQEPVHEELALRRRDCGSAAAAPTEDVARGHSARWVSSHLPHARSTAVDGEDIVIHDGDNDDGGLAAAAAAVVAVHTTVSREEPESVPPGHGAAVEGAFTQPLQEGPPSAADASFMAGGEPIWKGVTVAPAPPPPRPQCCADLVEQDNEQELRQPSRDLDASPLRQDATGRLPADAGPLPSQLQYTVVQPIGVSSWADTAPEVTAVTADAKSDEPPPNDSIASFALGHLLSNRSITFSPRSKMAPLGGRDLFSLGRSARPALHSALLPPKRLSLSSPEATIADSALVSADAPSATAALSDAVPSLGAPHGDGTVSETRQSSATGSSRNTVAPPAPSAAARLTDAAWRAPEVGEAGLLKPPQDALPRPAADATPHHVREDGMDGDASGAAGVPLHGGGDDLQQGTAIVRADGTHSDVPCPHLYDEVHPQGWAPPATEDTTSTTTVHHPTHGVTLAGSSVREGQAILSDLQDGVVDGGGGSSDDRDRLSFNGSLVGAGPAIPESMRAYVESLAEYHRQQPPMPPALLGNASFIHLSSNLPVMSNRSFIGGVVASGERGGRLGEGTAALELPQAGAAGVCREGAGRRMSVECSSEMGRELASNLPEEEVAGPLFTNTSFVDLLRSFAGVKRIGSRLVMPQLSPSRSASAAASDDGNDNGDGDVYVLMNSDIHSVGAFLFGLRSLITHVEDLEIHLLEVVHGAEIAKKL